MSAKSSRLRRTRQHELPVHKQASVEPGFYDIYPTHPAAGVVDAGYERLARELARHERVVLDGFAGVLWEEVRSALDRNLRALGIEAAWLDVASALRPPAEIARLTGPSLGDDAVFGKKFTGDIADFFDSERLARLRPVPGAELSMLYGSGAALAGWDAPTVYFDVAKNEISFRARAGSVGNLGLPPADPKEMYRRSYFVDWPVLSRHKKELLPRIDLYVDSQRPGEPTFAAGRDVRRTLEGLARTAFRARPWFEPGAWGGQWMAERIQGLNEEVPNYAWSFELITPENGLILEHGDRLLEVSFDMLMYQCGEEVLGTAHARFGDEFPIRFDLLDTVEGGNLSVQCHPSDEYIRSEFGESFTQDETYYILDCVPGAKVYLGFEGGVDPAEFRSELERSEREGVEVDIERYVRSREVRKHDFYLIPNGTVHCSGRGNLVLEISATPYIFTFKMYDWLRLDLDGKPRPINIERAFDNLDFEREGAKVDTELVSRPRELDRGDGWRLEQLPTHVQHFYEVRRYTVAGQVRVDTDSACHVMSLVEGSSIVVVNDDGTRKRFSYAETFVVPAAAGSYRLVNGGRRPAVVVQAMVKQGE